MNCHEYLFGCVSSTRIKPRIGWGGTCKICVQEAFSLTFHPNTAINKTTRCTRVREKERASKMTSSSESSDDCRVLVKFAPLTVGKEMMSGHWIEFCNPSYLH
jgi:hypothetical protein